jgi:hypothetical protein
MDRYISEIITVLKTKRAMLDAAIHTLEEDGKDVHEVKVPFVRRKPVFSPASKKRISKRMKAFWAEKRKAGTKTAHRAKKSTT